MIFSGSVLREPEQPRVASKSNQANPTHKVRRILLPLFDKHAEPQKSLTTSPPARVTIAGIALSDW
jgi:hypothetical protein